MKRLVSLLLALTLCLVVLSASADLYSGADFIVKLPKTNPAYLKDCEHHGTVEKVTYSTHAYAIEAVASGDFATAPGEEPGQIPLDVQALCGDQTEFPLEKTLYVYLPYGYDPAQKYDVLFLLHGTGEHEDLWLGEGTVGTNTRNILDWMIDEGVCKPLIVVTPTYYAIPPEKAELFTDLGAGDMIANVWPMYFWMEMRNEIVPLIDGRFATFGAEPDARDHRAFMGISRGSMTTADSMILHCFDEFSSFANLSGIWCDFDTFKAALESDEYSALPMKLWYNGNGSTDFSAEHHQAFYQRVLAEMPDRFTDGGNCVWVSVKGAGHTYAGWFPQIYNLLQMLFR